MLNIKVMTIPESPNYVELTESGDKWEGANLHAAIVVKDGMASGNPAVDLQFTDKDGNKFIAMVKGSLLMALGDIIKAHSKEL